MDKVDNKTILCIDTTCDNTIVSAKEADLQIGFCDDCYKKRAHVFKIQSSVVSTESTGQMLIYNRSRETIYEADLDPDINIKLNGRLKAYFYGIIDINDKIVIAQEAPESEHF